jgi:hypothetical protein
VQRWLKQCFPLQHKIDQLLLESSKSSLAYDTASKQSNSSKAAHVSFVNQALKGVSQSYQRELLAQAAVSAWSLRWTPNSDLRQDVSIDDCLRVIKTYLQPLFESSSSVAAVATAKAKAEEVVAALEKMGYSPELRLIEDDEEEGSESTSEMGSDVSMSSA